MTRRAWAALLLLGCCCRRQDGPSAKFGGTHGAHAAVARVDAPPLPAATAPRLAALLDIASDQEAKVVALVGKDGWQPVELVAPGTLEQLAVSGMPYRMISPPASGRSRGNVASGALSGAVRKTCIDTFLLLTPPQSQRGFAAAAVGRPRRDGGSNPSWSPRGREDRARARLGGSNRHPARYQAQGRSRDRTGLPSRSRREWTTRPHSPGDSRRPER